MQHSSDRAPSRTLQGREATLLGLAVVLLATACGDSGTEPENPTEPDPAGTIAFSVTTGGEEIDPDGYTVQVGSGPASQIGVNGSVTLDAPAGSATVLLGGVSAACDGTTGTRSVQGITSSVTVPSGGSVSLGLVIECRRKEIVFIRAGSNGTELALMSLDGTGRAPLKSDNGQSMRWEPQWSPDGSRIAYVDDEGQGNSEIFVMDADGSNDEKICCGPAQGGGAAFDQSPTWSPDGSAIAWVRQGEEEGIYRMNPDGSDRTRLTDRFEGDPDWGPDGRIAFIRQAREAEFNDWDLYVMDGDGGNLTLLVQGVAAGAGPAWSPDGSTILFSRSDENDVATTLWSVPSGGGAPTERPDADFRAAFPTWSPDGTRIVYEYWADGPWPPNAHGLCVGTPDGEGCDRMTTNGGTDFDVWPDWR
jgi:TolB protein